MNWMAWSKMTSRSIKSNFDLRLRGYLFIQIASTMRKCARIHGPTLWKFPPAVKAWRNSTTTTYFRPACHTDECNINKLLQSKQTEEARQRRKQIRDRPGRMGEAPRGLLCLSPSTIQVHGDAWPSVRFWAGAPSTKYDGTLWMPRQK